MSQLELVADRTRLKLFRQILKSRLRDCQETFFFAVKKKRTKKYWFSQLLQPRTKDKLYYLGSSQDSEYSDLLLVCEKTTRIPRSIPWPITTLINRQIPLRSLTKKKLVMSLEDCLRSTAWKMDCSFSCYLNPLEEWKNLRRDHTL
jgi:hypothetical protein